MIRIWIRKEARVKEILEELNYRALGKISIGENSEGLKIKDDLLANWIFSYWLYHMLI